MKNGSGSKLPRIRTKEQAIADVYEQGRRDSLVDVCAVLDEARKSVKQQMGLLDVRQALDSFVDQFIAFIYQKLDETKRKEEHGRIQ